MFDYDPPEDEEKEPTDYTGLIFAAILAPVFFLFIYLGKPDMRYHQCALFLRLFRGF